MKPSIRAWALGIACLCLPVWLPAQPQTYAAARGQYYGLVFAPNEEAHSGSTYLNLELHSLGSVSGQLVIGGRSRKVSGSVLPDGQATLVLYRGKKEKTDSDEGGNDWDVKGNAWLNFDLSGGSGGVWGWLVKDPSFTFAGAKATYGGSQPAPQAGRYTLALPEGDGLTAPAGTSVATLDVRTDGQVRISMFAADGKQQRGQVRLTGVGDLPTFLNLYDGNGSMLGHLEMTPEDRATISGVLVWTRPAPGASPDFPEGWVYAAAVVSSPYQPPGKGEGALPLQSGKVLFTGADLETPVEHTFEVTNGKVTEASPGLALKFVPSTGLFTGSFLHPATGKKVPFRGVVMQEQNRGYGNFRSADKRIGNVTLTPVF